jgi:1-acyl-sn-glycerol-3-phosphate acyltransferase
VSAPAASAAASLALRRAGESPLARWARRAATLPGLFAVGGFALALLPVLLPLALALDLAARRRLAATRLLLFALVWVACEAAGLVASFLLWVGCGTWLGAPRGPFLAANFRLQVIWAGALFGAARRLFALEVAVADEACAGERPLLVFVRHASLVDTLLPAVLLSGRHGLRLRYVLKRELLADPCLDVVGQRLPNVFVRRGSGQAEREVEAIRALAVGLGPREGVLIYPEGTRASPLRRERALARLAAAGDTARLERARALRHLLPPRSGGPLGLLEASPHADVLFMAHTGLEGIVRVRDAWSGALVGRRIEIGFWRVPAAELPRGREARLAWLDAEWARMDRWVDERRSAAAAP